VNRFRTLLTLLLAVALIAAACGSDSVDDGDESEEVERPGRIVSLSPTATEILFAIGAGDQVVAVDEFSNYPPEAPTTDLSGFDPNIEAIVSYDPDLVVVAYDANDLVAGLTALEIPVLFSGAPIDIEGGYAVLQELAAAVGRSDEAAALIDEMRAAIEEAVATGPGVPLRVYHELDENYFSASSAGFIGAVYSALGVVNIVASRPGWSEVTAVREGNIVVVEADTASRWGPRLPDFIRAIAEALSAAASVSQ
jgi:iron complex transport system substrate-binding protein